jgi:DNA gyrase/topoisomerase IV subunit B
MKTNKIIQLSEHDHVLTRSGMYVGSLLKEKHTRWVFAKDKISKEEIEIIPGFLKLFDEIISNSIDEYFRTDGKDANKIEVSIVDGEITVKDNGRGLPQEISDNNKTMAEIAVTSLRAGTNFEENSVSIGTNGLGASLVNLFSKSFKVTTTDGKNRLKLESSNNMNKTLVSITKNSGKSGTSISYFPDYERFNMENLDEDHIEFIKKRLIDLAACFSSIKFSFNGEKITTSKFSNYCNMISHNNEIVESNNFKIGVISSETKDQISFVNGIETFRGGGHVEYVSTHISYEILEKLNKKHKLKLKISDIKNKLMFVVFLTGVNGLTFDSQTKERITNTSRFFQSYFDTKKMNKLVDDVIKNDNIILPIIEAILLKRKLKEEAELRLKQKANRKKKIAKHIEAKGPNNTCFILEGASAISNLIKVRDAKTQGGFPLKGKVMNTIGMSPNDIVRNEEISSLLTILGLEFGKEAKSLNYDYVGILTDADVDGSHIATLLIGLFSHWPELFKNGKIKFYSAPLMIAKKGKQEKLLYSLDEIANENLKGWKTSYLKGLGALNENIYEKVINQIPETIDWDENTENSIKIALDGDFIDERKTWLLD